MTKMCKQAELGIVLIVCANAQAVVMLQRCQTEKIASPLHHRRIVTTKLEHFLVGSTAMSVLSLLLLDANLI